MVEILSRLPAGELPVVLCLGLLAMVVCVIGLANIVANAWRRYQERKLATSVVLEMLNRQMSFDQIRDVVLAMDMEDSLDRALTLGQRSEDASNDPDPSTGEATESHEPAKSLPHPACSRSRSALWLPRRVAL